MKTATKVIIPVVIVVAGFVAMTSLLGLRSDPPRQERELRAKIVQTSVVRLAPVQARVSAFGRTTSAQPIQLIAEVSGTLQQGEVQFKPAQRFSKGDLILKIDDRQARLELNSRQSDLMTALASVLPEIKSEFPEAYSTWQEYFDATQFDLKVPDLPDTQNRKIRMYLSRSNVYQLYFSIRDLEIQLEKHYFYAPFDGSIVTTDSRVGSAVRPGSSLGQIIDLERMEVALQLRAEDARWTNSQLPVTLTSTEMAGEWKADISRIGSNVDLRTQTVEVYVSIENNEAPPLPNGVFLEAALGGKVVEDGVVVPPKAVYGEQYVYVIENGALSQREVAIARREIERIIIDGGLNNGDTLVVEPMQGVAPGMPALSRNTATIDGDA